MERVLDSGDAVKYKNNETWLIPKQANRFSVGEVMFLFGCDTPQYGTVRGPLLIEEIKHQSDTGVSFFLMPIGPIGAPRARKYLIEFARTQILHRLSGPPVLTVIEEMP